MTSAARALLNEVSAAVSVDTALLHALECDTTALERAETSDVIAVAMETTWFNTEVVNDRLGLVVSSFAISPNVSNADGALPIMLVIAVAIAELRLPTSAVIAAVMVAFAVVNDATEAVIRVVIDTT